jgi:transcriptional regulator with XRE-family HTH domain
VIIAMVRRINCWHNTSMRMDFLRKWLADEIARAKATGHGKINQGALARHLGITDSELSRFLSGKRKELTLEQLMAAAEFLGTDLPEQLFASQKLYVKKAPLRGTIAAGILRVREMNASAHISNIAYLPIDTFSEYEQYVYQLVDDHAQDYAPNQACVIFVDFSKARDRPQHGDIVRVEEKVLVSGRTKTREMTEATLRRVEVTRTNITLRRLSSTHPDLTDITYDPEEKTIRIADLAIGYIVITAEAGTPKS